MLCEEQRDPPRSKPETFSCATTSSKLQILDWVDGREKKLVAMQGLTLEQATTTTST